MQLLKLSNMDFREKFSLSRYLVIGELTNVTNEFQGIWHSLEYLVINFSGDTERTKSSIKNNYAIESSRFSFFDEILSVFGLDFDRLSDIFEGLPLLMGAV